MKIKVEVQSSMPLLLFACGCDGWSSSTLLDLQARRQARGGEAKREKDLVLDV